MDLADAFRRRRMVRSYRPELVDDEVLARILAAGASAPSAGNTLGQHLVVVTAERTRRTIAGLAREDDHVARGLPPWLSRAPVHIVVAASPEAYRRRYTAADKAASVPPDAWPVPYWWLDAGAVVMALLLATTGEGLGAGFLGIHAFAPGLADLLGLPADIEPVGVVTVGHPAGPLVTARRRAHGSVVHRERWGPRVVGTELEGNEVTGADTEPSR